MAKARLLAGSTIKIYTGDVGEAATTIVATTGAIDPTAADWSLVAQGKYDDGVTIENQDERQELRFQGSKGRVSEERRTATGLMIVVPTWEATPDFAAVAWGNSVTETAGSSTQVGVKTQDFDLPLSVPEYGIQCVIDSPYDEDGDEGWLGLIYIPKGTLKIGAFNLAIDPEATSLEIKQLDYSTKAFWQTVTADAA